MEGPGAQSAKVTDLTEKVCGVAGSCGGRLGGLSTVGDGDLGPKSSLGE